MLDKIDDDRVYGLAAVPDFAETRVCFAARHSGLWYSEDGGEQWQKIENLPGVLAGLPCSAVATSPNFPSDATVFAGIPGHILCSTDKGKSWTAIALATPPPFVTALALSPSYESDGIVFASTLEDGVFRSDDRGLSWQAWNFGLFDLNVLAIAVSPAFAHDRTVYAGTETGVFYSTNGGRAWRETGFANDLAPVLSLAISPQFEQDGTCFAGTESAGLFCSVNKGLTWQRVLDCEAINTLLLSEAFPVTTGILVVSNDVVWFSLDGGLSWSRRKSNDGLDAGFTSAVAPSGLALQSPLLVGLSDGRVLVEGLVSRESHDQPDAADQRQADP